VGVSGGSKNVEKGRAEDNVSAVSSFFTNAHNELYAFYIGKGCFLKKKSEPTREGAAAPTTPLNPPLRHSDFLLHRVTHNCFLF